MRIWAYGHMRKKYGQVGYPRKEHQKCSSGMLKSGRQDPPFKSYGQQLFSQGKCLVFYIETLKKIRNTFSRPDRDLAQKAKCSEILCRSIIQASPTISIKLCKSVSVYCQIHKYTNTSTQIHKYSISERVRNTIYTYIFEKPMIQGHQK